MTVLLRPATQNDIPEIVTLVRNVVFEVYADLLEKHGEPPKGEPARWAKAHVAVIDGKIVGAGLADGDLISDLWVLKTHRSNGVGAMLLVALEQKIKRGGHTAARLRVVETNTAAQRFYRRHGWRDGRTYPHERDGHLMRDMEKRFD